jgi:micrococcal nuclease
MANTILTAAALFALCAPGPRTTCVVDGDTFWLEGEKPMNSGWATPRPVA